MPLYFLAAPSVAAIKVGVSADPLKRLQSVQVWSPVPLHVAAVYEPGDLLTEAELLHRFRDHRLHGEWVRVVPALMSAIHAVRAGGELPGAWRLPKGYARKGSTAGSAGSVPYGRRISDVIRQFGMSASSYREAVEARVTYTASCRIPMAHLLSLIHI